MHVCFLYVVIFIYVFCTINIFFSLKNKKGWSYHLHYIEYTYPILHVIVDRWLIICSCEICIQRVALMASCKTVLWHECSIVLQPGSCVFRHTGRYSFDYVERLQSLWRAYDFGFIYITQHFWFKYYVVVLSI